MTNVISGDSVDIWGIIKRCLPSHCGKRPLNYSAKHKLKDGQTQMPVVFVSTFVLKRVKSRPTHLLSFENHPFDRSTVTNKTTFIDKTILAGIAGPVLFLRLPASLTTARVAEICPRISPPQPIYVSTLPPAAHRIRR